MTIQYTLTSKPHLSLELSNTQTKEKVEEKRSDMRFELTYEAPTRDLGWFIKQRYDKHASNIERVGRVFIPLVVEILDVWLPFALRILKIATRSSVHSGPNTRIAANHLVQ